MKSLNSRAFLYKVLILTVRNQAPHTSFFPLCYYRNSVFCGARNRLMLLDFSISSFSSGQNKPLSQRAALHRIYSFLACYKVIREETKARKTNTEAIILLMFPDREAWVIFSQRKLKVCKLTT